MDLCKYTEDLWRMYILGDMEAEGLQLIGNMDADVVIIGTGRHEFYEKQQEFFAALELEARERDSIRFKIQSLHCRERRLGDSVSFVYGTIHIQGEDTNCHGVVNMDSRFSIVYEKKEGRWKAVHIHQSMPYEDQKEGEYYPKTLLQQVHREKKRADEMEELAKADGLTGLLNHRFFFRESEEMVSQSKITCCMVLDMDNFKRVNDYYGHQMGDQVLKTMADIIRKAVGEKGVVGRIGGDEFCVFCYDKESEAVSKGIENEILNKVETEQKQRKHFFPGVSIGTAQTREGETVKQVFRRADAELYKVKRDKHKL